MNWSIDPTKLDEPLILREQPKSQRQSRESERRALLKEYSNRFRNCEFWIWDKELHANRYHLMDGKCCFNHMIGLPEKRDRPQPLFPYQKEVLDACMNALDNFDERYLWIKKATGLGITEFVLRFIAWICLRDDKYARTEMCFITGPNIKMSQDLITRLKDLFRNPANNIGAMISDFDSSAEMIVLNNVKIMAFPSHHLNALRGRPNISLLFVDEADFFPRNMQTEVRTVTERYIAKSQPIIIMVSTPNLPGGLFETMESEIELGENHLGPKSLYLPLRLNYEKGLSVDGIPNMFTAEEIKKQKISPDFEREYNLKYGYGLGNIVSEGTVNKAISLGVTLGETLDETFGITTLQADPFSTRIMGVDPGFGGNDGSKFGIVVIEFLKETGVLRVLYSQEIKAGDYNDILNTVWSLVTKFDIERVYVDGSQVSFIKSLKKNFGEETEYHNDTTDPSFWNVYPCNFSKDGRVLLQKLTKFLANNKIAIGKRFANLTNQLRTARHNEFLLQKDKHSKQTYDELDALRMILKHFAY
jgi:hypothetical protein